MPWTLTHLKEKGIILVQSTGKYQLSGLSEMVKTVSEKFQEFNCNKTLVDHRKADVSLKTVPSYNRPKLYDEAGFGSNHKGAILFKEIADEHRFFEDTIRNKGWNLRVFDDYDAAMAWLEE